MLLVGVIDQDAAIAIFAGYGVGVDVCPDNGASRCGAVCVTENLFDAAAGVRVVSFDVVDLFDPLQRAVLVGAVVAARSHHQIDAKLAGHIADVSLEWIDQIGVGNDALLPGVIRHFHFDNDGTVVSREDAGKGVMGFNVKMAGQARFALGEYHFVLQICALFPAF